MPDTTGQDIDIMNGHYDQRVIKEMSPKSSSLFHFTRSIDNLKGILEHGFRPRYCLEDSKNMGIDYLAYPMICFCDIPISRIQEHTSFYGEYGLGMTKEWGLKNKLEPLLYATSTGAVVDFANFFVGIESTSTRRGKYKVLYDGMLEHFDRIVSLVKPISGNMLVRGKVVEKDFHQENEWRYVPDGYEILLQKEFEDEAAKRNLEFERQAVKFTPADVKYIFVKSDAEIPVVFDFIQNNLGHWPHNDIKILTSRITSLETVAKDL